MTVEQMEEEVMVLDVIVRILVECRDINELDSVWVTFIMSHNDHFF